MMRYFKWILVVALTHAIIITDAQTKKTPSTKAPVTKGRTASPGKHYSYETFPDDPLKARIYTLDNGLKVYLSVYKNEPRFQSMIGVKAGSKTDPRDATGLAHYLEHMLFKGTDKFGTLDYAKEKPLLDTINNLYDVYGKTTDSLQRISIYHKIDSVSNAASHFAIANEFDKMMSSLGVSGTNAFTSVEQTVYVNDVPANQMQNFITVEAERFRNPVMRLFHTELEAVYEEKNRGLDNDGRKIYEALFSGLWKNHPYGTQTTIGTIEHLKSPSLKKIREYLETYYVPNNMVIALSGDINPDETIKIIDEHFGNMKAKPIPEFKSPNENLIKQPIVKEVYGPDAESVTMGFRFGGAATEDADVLTMVDLILGNGQAGLFDLNLVQAQKVLSASSGVDMMKDYSAHILSGRPREGQTLEQVRDSLLAQIMEIKLGNFPDWLLGAIINNLKLQQARDNESNRERVSEMINSEILGVDYKNEVNRIDRLSKINKQQVIDFVRTWYGDDYVIVYKRTGEDTSIVKVAKPVITPVETNTDSQSPFLKNITEAKVKSIAPVFVDFNKAIKKLKLNNKAVTVQYVQNNENKLFDLYYVINMGTNTNNKLGLALSYLKYLGTDKYTASQLQQEFYKLGCEYNVFSSEDQVYISLSGLSESFAKALPLFEEVVNNPKGDDAALKNLVTDVLKRRTDAKLNKGTILRSMQYYAKYGPESPFTNIVREPDLKKMTPIELTQLIQSLLRFEHHINYYGPADTTELVMQLNKNHFVPAELKPMPAPHLFTEYPTTTNEIYFVQYDMKQAEIQLFSKGKNYDKTIEPQLRLYNEYFGGSMASPVFQELRESKALAYSVASRVNKPSFKDRAYWNFAYIGTQADKVPEALKGLMDLLTTFPLSESGFVAAKSSLVQEIQTERISKSDILFTYDANKKLGIDYDLRKDVYDKLPTLTLKDLKAFHHQNIAADKYNIMVLGNRNRINQEALRNGGPITDLELHELFGY